MTEDINVNKESCVSSISNKVDEISNVNLNDGDLSINSQVPVQNTKNNCIPKKKFVVERVYENIANVSSVNAGLDTSACDQKTEISKDIFQHNTSFGAAPVLPTSAQYGLAVLPSSDALNVSADKPEFKKSSSNVVDSNVENKKRHANYIQTRSTPDRNDRFKIVKIEPTQPFKRGRWLCMDFSDHSMAQPSRVSKEQQELPNGEIEDRQHQLKNVTSDQNMHVEACKPSVNQNIGDESSNTNSTISVPIETQEVTNTEKLKPNTALVNGFSTITTNAGSVSPGQSLECPMHRVNDINIPNSAHIQQNLFPSQSSDSCKYTQTGPSVHLHQNPVSSTAQVSINTPAAQSASQQKPSNDQVQVRLVQQPSLQEQHLYLVHQSMQDPSKSNLVQQQGNVSQSHQHLVDQQHICQQHSHHNQCAEQYVQHSGVMQQSQEQAAFNQIQQGSAHMQHQTIQSSQPQSQNMVPNQSHAQSNPQLPPIQQHQSQIQTVIQQAPQQVQAQARLQPQLQQQQGNQQPQIQLHQGQHQIQQQPQISQIQQQSQVQPQMQQQSHAQSQMHQQAQVQSQIQQQSLMQQQSQPQPQMHKQSQMQPQQHIQQEHIQHSQTQQPTQIPQVQILQPNVQLQHQQVHQQQLQQTQIPQSQIQQNQIPQSQIQQQLQQQSQSQQLQQQSQSQQQQQQQSQQHQIHQQIQQPQVNPSSQPQMQHSSQVQSHPTIQQPQLQQPQSQPPQVIHQVSHQPAPIQQSQIQQPPQFQQDPTQIQQSQIPQQPPHFQQDPAQIQQSQISQQPLQYQQDSTQLQQSQISQSQYQQPQSSSLPLSQHQQTVMQHQLLHQQQSVDQSQHPVTGLHDSYSSGQHGGPIVMQQQQPQQIPLQQPILAPQSQPLQNQNIAQMPQAQHTIQQYSSSPNVSQHIPMPIQNQTTYQQPPVGAEIQSIPSQYCISHEQIPQVPSQQPYIQCQPYYVSTSQSMNQNIISAPSVVQQSQISQPISVTSQMPQQNFAIQPTVLQNANILSNMPSQSQGLQQSQQLTSNGNPNMANYTHVPNLQQNTSPSSQNVYTSLVSSMPVSQNSQYIPSTQHYTPGQSLTQIQAQLQQQTSMQKNVGSEQEIFYTPAQRSAASQATAYPPNQNQPASYPLSAGHVEIHADAANAIRQLHQNHIFHGGSLASGTGSHQSYQSSVDSTRTISEHHPSIIHHFPEQVAEMPDENVYNNSEENDSSENGNNGVAIDNKIEQAMDLVKSHLMFAVREEVEVLKEKIAELMDRIAQLEMENSILKANASAEILAQLSSHSQLSSDNNAVAAAVATNTTQQLPQPQPP